MQILNTSTHEKLKIRAVNPSELVSFIHVNPYEMSVNDLKSGYILKTCLGTSGYPVDNVYMLFEIDIARKLVYYLKSTEITTDYVMLRPSRGKKPHIHWNDMKRYLKTWPVYFGNDNLNVTDVWKTDLDMTMFKSDTDIAIFFLINMIYLIYENTGFLII